MEGGARLAEALRARLAAGSRAALTTLLDAVHPADLAGALPELLPEQRVALFRLLPPDRAGEVLSEMDDDTLLQLVQGLDEAEVSKILDRMAPDEAAGVVEELPPEQAEKILHLMTAERSEDVQELLEYPEDSAGRVMSPAVLAVPESATVAAVIEHVRRAAPDDRGFDVYVVDAHGHLLGTVPPRRLLIAAPATPVSAILQPDVVTVTPETGQEEVARLVARYGLASVPVVDRDRRLLGVIDVEDVIELLGEEASEDIFRLAGSDAAELERRSPTRIALMRLPWILVMLAMELVAAAVIRAYDRTLSQVILLASFIPVIQALSGSTGLQSVTMVVRGLATGDIRLDRWWRPFWRQLQTTALLATVCGALAGAVGAAWHGTLAFGAVVALAMFISVNVSGLAGTAFPLASRRLGFDPALTAGPFATAFQDVVGVTIYLALATALLPWLA